MEKFPKINKNLLLGIVVVLCLSMSFLLIAQNVNFVVIIEGGGGGSHPSTPTLDQPTSPDYDNSITLNWNSVYSATSYRVYRSTSQYGVYSVITTTPYSTYTDIRDLGAWWYKVKAFNYYGASDYSNAVGVMVPNQFNQLYSEGGYIYSPTKSSIHSSSYDNAVITINVKQDTDAQGNAYNNHPWFCPAITVTLNPDGDEPKFGHTKFYYIHSFKLCWKLKNPLGNYLNYDNIDEILTKYYSLDGLNQYTDMNRLVDLIFALYNLIPYSCSDILKALIVPSYTHSTFIQGHDTNYDFWVKWTEGYTFVSAYAPQVPNNCIEEASMLLTFASWLPAISGMYTLEFSWEMVVYLYDRFFDWFSYITWVDADYAFTLTGSYSLSFNF